MPPMEWREVNKQLGNDSELISNADTGWFGALLRTGVSQNHSLSLSGGGSKNNYRASYMSGSKVLLVITG